MAISRPFLLALLGAVLLAATYFAMQSARNAPVASQSEQPATVDQPGPAAARADEFSHAEVTGGPAPATDSARRFRRALDQKREVVLFFSQGAADDKATAAAVHSLERGNGGLLVLKDDVDNVDAYGKLVEQLGVYQAPAIVIVAPSGDARLLEGYVDAGVLAQEVADAR